MQPRFCARRTTLSSRTKDKRSQMFFPGLNFFSEQIASVVCAFSLIMWVSNLRRTLLLLFTLFSKNKSSQSSPAPLFSCWYADGDNNNKDPRARLKMCADHFSRTLNNPSVKEAWAFVNETGVACTVVTDSTKVFFLDRQHPCFH